MRWLHENAPGLRAKRQPFLMVASFVNPHDIMFVDANVPGKPAVQKALAQGVLAPVPRSALYERQWELTLPRSLQESLKAPECRRRWRSTTAVGRASSASSRPTARICGTATTTTTSTACATATAASSLCKHNDVQVFDLKEDPDEMRNLALEPEKHQALILRLNGLLNEYVAREIGVNDGGFLPKIVRPRKAPLTFE